MDAVGVFALRVLDTAATSATGPCETPGGRLHHQNALEVVLGIGTYTMSTLANRLTGAPVDDQLPLRLSVIVYCMAAATMPLELHVWQGQPT